MRIAVSGASGLVGSALSTALHARGDRVVRVVRRTGTPGPDEARLDVPTRTVRGFEGSDAVVHLAGEPIVGRWTQGKRREIRASRVDTTHLLAEELATQDAPPRTLVVASAAGYYGDRGDEPLPESAQPGEGFLADVVASWEDAAAPARKAGIRTVHMRKGMVLAKRGGALAQMLPFFRMGLGGPVGSGRQIVSWVALDDAVGAYLHAIDAPSLDGPVNCAALGAVPNADFARILAGAVGRRARLRTPAWVVRAAFGAVADEVLLSSQRLVPSRLQESGFRFRFPELEPALRHELSK